VKVANLNLKVTGVHPVDAKLFNQFNSADTAVDIDTTNARGDSYTFNANLGMKVVDENGVAYDPELACYKCPNELSHAQLVKGGHAAGSVYYKMAGPRRSPCSTSRFARRIKRRIMSPPQPTPDDVGASTPERAAVGYVHTRMQRCNPGTGTSEHERREATKVCIVTSRLYRRHQDILAAAGDRGRVHGPPRTCYWLLDG
jgi:hypothetical protein